MKNPKAVIIDIDDTVLNLSDRRLALYKKHFPHAEGDEEHIRRDVALRFLGESTLAAEKYLEEFLNPDAATKFPVSAISGSTSAIESLLERGFKIIFITGRSSSFKSDVVDSLKSIGITKDSYELHMSPAKEQTHPNDSQSDLNYKKAMMKTIASSNDIIAAIGDRVSDAKAAIETKIPAILLETTYHEESEFSYLTTLPHIGLEKCGTWSEALLAIGRLELGNVQMEKLREMFTIDYSSWLQNLNSIAAINVTVAGVLAAFVSQLFISEEQFDWLTKLLLVPSLVLSLLSIVFAIRAYTPRYTSGLNINRPIAAKAKQYFQILIDNNREGYLVGDAIDAYTKLKSASEFDQSQAHLDFFFKQYGTYNPSALLNLRLYQLRSTNYARVYPAAVSSKFLLWNAMYILFWVFLVGIFGTNLATRASQLNTSVREFLTWIGTIF